MRNVAICGSRVKALLPENRSIETVEIKGIPVTCGLIFSPEPHFDQAAPENRFNVLLRTQAFSCNYRDLSLIFAALKRGSENSFYAAGSDLVGEVLEVGFDVTSLKPGDRVIPDNSYCMSANLKAADGVLTNRASKEYQVFPESKLMKIPDRMPTEVAGAFSIGAQTAYSIIRKLNPVVGANVLITSARSNTSLFVINALRKYRVNTYATTTSTGLERRLQDMGVREVIEVSRSWTPFMTNERLRDIALSLGGFDYVIDPFFDLHLDRAIDSLAPDGKYITCGLHEQYQALLGIRGSDEGPMMKRVLLSVLIKNLQIIGNCLGTTEDLKNALQDFSSGALKVAIDDVFADNEVGAFFHKTYTANERFGKVVYRYN